MAEHSEHGIEQAGPTAWAEVYDALATADASGPLDVADLERLAVAAYFLGRDDESTSAWERAHRVWLRLGDRDRSARCAFWLGFQLMLQGDAAPANGWFARGRRVIGDADDCAARGYLLMPTAMEALDAGDPETAMTRYEEIGEIAERCGDVDLLAISRLGRGEVAIASGDIPAGLALFDEVMVAATTGETSPITTGILYCAVVGACVDVFDLRRAAEWTEALTRWCDRQLDLVPFRGSCLVHRSQVLQARGEWTAALVEATRAQVRMSEPLHPAIGVAYYQQAELHRLRGEFAEADEAYHHASEHGRAPTPGIALLRLAEGRVAPARAAVLRMLNESRDALSRLAVLPAFVDVTIAAGDVDEAAGASDELARIADATESPYVDALAEHARATVLIARSRPAEALEAARRACRTWKTLDLPYECARSQVVVARACAALGDHDTAEVELQAARVAFERLGAGPDAARATELTSAVLPPATNLTARECDVLRLVASGKTNREIGVDLTISEHTVARHVQNIFAKVDVSSRAAATAYAYEHGIL